MISVELDNIKDLDNLKIEWSELEKNSDCSFFLTWQWIGVWLTTINTCNNLGILRIKDGQYLIGLCIVGKQQRFIKNIVPVNSFLVNQFGSQVFDAPTIEHNNLLIKKGFEKKVFESIFDYIQSANFKADTLVINNINNFTKNLIYYTPNSALFHQSDSTADYFTNLSNFSTDNDFLQSRSRSLRYEFNRAKRIYEDLYGEMTFTMASTENEALEFFENMLHLNCEYWLKKTGQAVFQDQFMLEFHKNLIKGSFDSGYIQVSKVAAGNYVLGYLYNFRHNDWIYAYQSGFNYDNDNRLKPGIISHIMAIGYAIDTGGLRYDFLAGDHQYKKRLATNEDTMHSIELAKHNFKTRTLFFCRDILQKFF